MVDEAPKDLAKEEAFKRFEELGVDQVRQLHATGGLPTAWNLYTIYWLNDKAKGKSKNEQHSID